MTKEEAVSYYGTQQKLAAVLKLEQGTISGWLKVPLAHQFYLERITGGDLKADPHPAEATASAPD